MTLISDHCRDFGIDFLSRNGIKHPACERYNHLTPEGIHRFIVCIIPEVSYSYLTKRHYPLNRNALFRFHVPYTCNNVSGCVCRSILNSTHVSDPGQFRCNSPYRAGMVFDVDPYHSNTLYTVPERWVRPTDDGHILLVVKDWILNDCFNVC